MSTRTGQECKLYRLGSGTRATWGPENSDGIHEGAAPGALVEIPNVRDLTPNLEVGEADTSTRASDWTQRTPTMRDGGVEFQMVYNTSDTHYAAILKAWLKKQKIALAILDGDADEAGTQGLWADCYIFNVSNPQPLADAVMVTVTAKPGTSDVPPEYVLVG